MLKGDYAAHQCLTAKPSVRSDASGGSVRELGIPMSGVFTAVAGVVSKEHRA